MKKRDIAKTMGSIVSFAISACSGFAASQLITSRIQRTGNKWVDLATKIGVVGICSVVEGAVLNVCESDFNELVDSIAGAVDASKSKKQHKEHLKELLDDDTTIENPDVRAYSSHASGDTVIPFKQVQQKQAISFADPETANYAADQLRKQLEKSGYVSLWYLFNCLDEDKVQTTISDEDMKSHGWKSLDGMRVLETDDMKWLLVLPDCIEHEPVFEAIKKTSEDGTVVITTNGVEDND